ncbi:MAG: terminase large subunit [Bacteroidales bacterium]|jgi:phage terminase large subunit-like protein|nr:terminase large subunit [Bacteroidales bacterium]
MSYIQEYYNEIKTGKVLVSKKVRIQVEKLLYLIDNPDKNFITQFDGTKEYFEYNEAHAERVIGFIETFCKHVKGSAFAGKYIKLELWQKVLISALYAFVSVETGFRKFRRLHLYIGRKNGKTLLAACIIIYELVMGGEKGAECYTGATKRDQAKIAWDMAKLIIQKSPILASKFSVNVHGIFLLPFRDSLFLPISKESKKLDGLNAHISHIDELHAITDSNIIDVMWDSSKSRSQPIELITTTMGTERQSTFDEVYDYDSNVLAGVWDDDRLLVFCYELDEEKEWMDIKNAYKANPNLGVSQSINGLYEEIEKALSDVSKRVNLLCKSFNVRQTNAHAWLDFEVFDKPKVYDLEQFQDDIVLGGFDLARTGDLTAFTTLLFDKKEKRVVAETMYWATLNWIEKTKKVPLQKWVEQGYIRVSGTDLINYIDIVDYLEEMHDKHGWRYMFINYDRYSAGYLVNHLESLGYSKKHVLIPTAQGAKTLSVPMQELEGNLKSDVFSYQNNPVTKWCFSNVEVEEDRNGNFMPKKGSYERKIDGVATILNCYVSYVEHQSFFMAEE